MKKWKLIALISSLVLVVAVTISLILIFTYEKKEEPDYHYPTLIPTITSADDPFITLGTRNISNLEMYNMTIITYGLTSMNDLIDQKLLDLDSVSEDELLAKKRELYASIQGIEESEVDLDDEEQKKQFEEQMALQGFFGEEVIDKMLKLDIARQKLGKAKLQEEMANYVPTVEQPIFFSETEIDAVYQNMDDLCQKVKAIIIPFRSEGEATKLMKELGINTSKLNNGWVNSEGTTFTKDEIIDLFLAMYNKVYNSDLTKDEIPTYSKNELSQISSVITNNVFNNLADIETAENLKEAYVYNPMGKSYLTNYYYLAIRVETIDQFDLNKFYEDYNNDSLTGAYLELYQQLCDNYVSSSYINQLLYQMRFDKGLKIYDERLDISYYAQSYSAIGDKYQETLEESNQYVATFTGGSITADELFQEMMDRYGAVVAMQFANFYALFNDSYSTVYDFEHKTRLADYETAYNDSIATLKTSLENGEFENYGYSRYYGFENFLRDYSGLTYLDDAICLMDPYDLALDSFAGSLVYAHSDATLELYQKFNEAYVKKTIDIDAFLNYCDNLDDKVKESVIYKIIEQFNSFFSVKASTITYFIDENGDSLGKVMSEEEQAQGELLVKAILYLAKTNPQKMDAESTDPVYLLAQKIFNAIKAGKYSPYNNLSLSTLVERMNRLILIYNGSSLDDEIFGSFKALNLRLSYTTDTTYYSTNVNEAAVPVLRDFWLSILSEELVLDSGKKAYFERTTEINNETALKAIGISADAPYIIKDGVLMNNKVTRFIVTEVVNTTWYHFNEDSEGKITELIPSDQRLDILVNYYALSLIESEKRTKQQQDLYEQSSPVDFEAPYISNIIGPAYDALIASTTITEKLNKVRISLLQNETINFTNEKNKDRALWIMDLLG